MCVYVYICVRVRVRVRVRVYVCMCARTCTWVCANAYVCVTYAYAYVSVYRTTPRCLVCVNENIEEIKLLLAMVISFSESTTTCKHTIENMWARGYKTTTCVHHGPWYMAIINAFTLAPNVPDPTWDTTNAGIEQLKLLNTIKNKLINLSRLHSGI